MIQHTTLKDGKEVVLILDDDRVAKTPAWHPDTSEPPVTLSQASKLAQAWASKRFGKLDSVFVDRITIGHIGCPAVPRPDHFFYLVSFAASEQGHSESLDGAWVVVLMDASLATPVFVKDGHEVGS